MDAPHFGLTSHLDCTHLMRNLKPAGVSVFNAFLWCLMEAGNSVPEMRTRMRGDNVVEHDVLDASFTVPISEDRFAFCEVSYSSDWSRFYTACSRAVSAARKQPELMETTKETDSWLFLSCLPWMDFSGFYSPKKDRNDSIPRILWGKVMEERGKWKCAVCLELHHALADGIHMARFFERLQHNLDNLPLPEEGKQS